MFDGWRYLGMDPEAILALTPREYAILMTANLERQYDDYEKYASQAMMMRAAYHKEKLKPKDLFKRPTGDKAADKTSDDVRERQRRLLERLARFEEFKDIAT